MSSTAKWVIGIVGVLVLLFGLFMVLIFSWLVSDGEETTDSSTSYGDKVALVQLRETILSSEDIVRQFKKYRDNRSIRAIVFRVESPGGGVAASQEIYEEVKKTRDSGKPGKPWHDHRKYRRHHAVHTRFGVDEKVGDR
jgi:protease-4